MMNVRSRSAALTAGLLGLAAAATLLAQPALAAPTAADVAHGKALFMQDGCYTCHGTVGQGNRFSGPAIAPHPVPLTAFLRQLRTPANDMPAYAVKVLSDADADAIYAYLSSIPAGKPASDIPLLKAVTPATGGKP